MCQGSLQGGGAHRAPRTFRQTNSDIHTNLSFERISPLSKSRALLCPYSKSCSSSTSSMKIPAFAQAVPQYCSHAMEHFIPCFWQLHREELQSVAANDFQKISWCGCSVSENWKIPQVRKDPSPLICLKVTPLIFPLTNLQENPVAMKLGCCTYWWQISRFHFVQILCYFFTIF